VVQHVGRLGGVGGIFGSPDANAGPDAVPARAAQRPYREVAEQDEPGEQQHADDHDDRVVESDPVPDSGPRLVGRRRDRGPRGQAHRGVVDGRSPDRVDGDDGAHDQGGADEAVRRPLVARPEASGPGHQHDADDDGHRGQADIAAGMGIGAVVAGQVQSRPGGQPHGGDQHSDHHGDEQRRNSPAGAPGPIVDRAPPLDPAGLPGTLGVPVLRGGKRCAVVIRRRSARGAPPRRPPGRRCATL
jgi:hypothetical protein